jgi:hypothetical protein
VSKQNINIERLEIRLRGVSPELVRSAVRGFGKELLEQLTPTGSAGTNRIDRVDSGTLQIARGTRQVEVSCRMAKHVAASIRVKKE